MKKAVIIIAVMLLGLSASAQFTLTTEGLRSTHNPNKDYVLINANGRTAAEIYTKTMAYINEAYAFPDKVIKANTENEYIRLCTTYLCGYYSSVSRINFTIEIRIKEEKARYQVTNLDMHHADGSVMELVGLTGMYSKKGKLKQKGTKEGIEQHLNDLIVSLANKINDIRGEEDNW